MPFLVVGLFAAIAGAYAADKVLLPNGAVPATAPGSGPSMTTIMLYAGGALALVYVAKKVVKA